MLNTDIAAARRYHEGTNHTPERVAGGPRFLDPATRPLPYKIYETLEPLSLPPARDIPPSGVPALEAIAAPGREPAGERVPDLATLARLCVFSNGITKRIGRGDRVIDFRAAACTGALYHIELYLICGDLPDLAAGVYHYGAHDNGLRRLRAGDFRQVLVEATGAEPAVAAAPVVAVCTSTFWRNAWKYRSRAYRHTYWDGGTVLANLLAVAASAELPAEVVLGFADEPVGRLLDVDPGREAAFSLVALGRGGPAHRPAPPVVPLGLPTTPLSAEEIDYPPIGAIHTASSLASGDEATAWRVPPPPRPPVAPAGASTLLRPLPSADLPPDPVEAVIRRRGSTREFNREPIGFAQLSTILDRSLRGFAADCLEPAAAPLSDPYLIVSAVDSLAPGSYAFTRERRALELLEGGNFRDTAGFLALDQGLGADAAVNIYFMIDLEPVLARWGNRGYRVAQLEASINAGRIYLAAYALGLGATGLTFFDDEVSAFFSPHAAGKSVMFLVALGHRLRRGGA